MAGVSEVCGRVGVVSLPARPSLTSWRLILSLILLILVLPSHPVRGIRCYECVHNNQRMKRHNRFVYPCAEFDGSNRFIMDCPDSKLCIYQRITLQLSNEAVLVSTMDGCTPNTTDHSRYAEAGLVSEGCIQHKSKYKPPTSEYCYCAHDLCNAATHARPALTPLFVIPSLLSLLFSSWS